MSDAENILKIFTAIAGICCTIYVIIKSIKKCKTPCFEIQVDGTPVNTDIIGWMTHRVVSPKTKPPEPLPNAVLAPES